MSNLSRHASIPTEFDPWLGGQSGFSSVATSNGDIEPLATLALSLSYQNRRAALRIQPSIVYMLRHLNEELCVSKLSQIADISASHFFWLFKQATGDTPIQFLIRARMRRAQTLLQETGLTVKEIAAQLGYRDEFYFSRQFKSYYGSAPSHYRAAG